MTNRRREESSHASIHQHRQPKMPAALVVAPACHVAKKRSVTQANPVGGHFGHGGNVVGNFRGAGRQ